MDPLAPEFVPTSSQIWTATSFPGVEIVKLHSDAPEKGGTGLLKMAAGSVFPRHQHLGPEETYVLSGEVNFGVQTARAGDYFFMPTDSVHELVAYQDSLMLCTAPAGIQVLDAGAGAPAGVAA